MGDAGQKHIVVVEDEAAFARLVKWKLESEGYSVRTEKCGKAALTYIAESWPDLVILDVRLPDISGYEVCHELRELAYPLSIPVLMLTAMNRPIDQIRGFANGADAYMTKPVEAPELLETVAQLLSRTDRPGPRLDQGGRRP